MHEKLTYGGKILVKLEFMTMQDWHLSKIIIFINLYSVNNKLMLKKVVVLFIYFLRY